MGYIFSPLHFLSVCIAKAWEVKMLDAQISPYQGEAEAAYFLLTSFVGRQRVYEMGVLAHPNRIFLFCIVLVAHECQLHWVLELGDLGASLFWLAVEKLSVRWADSLLSVMCWQHGFIVE